jgi:hypothetical protein
MAAPTVLAAAAADSYRRSSKIKGIYVFILNSRVYGCLSLWLVMFRLAEG